MNKSENIVFTTKDLLKDENFGKEMLLHCFTDSRPGNITAGTRVVFDVIRRAALRADHLASTGEHFPLHDSETDFAAWVWTPNEAGISQVACFIASVQKRIGAWAPPATPAPDSRSLPSGDPGGSQGGNSRYANSLPRGRHDLGPRSRTRSAPVAPTRSLSGTQANPAPRNHGMAEWLEELEPFKTWPPPPEGVIEQFVEVEMHSMVADEVSSDISSIWPPIGRWINALASAPEISVELKDHRFWQDRSLMHPRVH